MIGPTVHGNVAVIANYGKSAGFLASYRYLLTPHSALEVNYSFGQNTTTYNYANSASANGVLVNNFVHTRQQELTFAYVYGLSYKRYNPFLEAGVGGVRFSPIIDSGTVALDLKPNNTLGGLFGGGVAYELSPSFDLRLQYRGIIVKTPDFKDSNFPTNKYELLSLPAFGVAYHF